jgi:hypothetical protein
VAIASPCRTRRARRKERGSKSPTRSSKDSAEASVRANPGSASGVRLSALVSSAAIAWRDAAQTSNSLSLTGAQTACRPSTGTGTSSPKAGRKPGGTGPDLCQPEPSITAQYSLSAGHFRQRSEFMGVGPLAGAGPHAAPARHRVSRRPLRSHSRRFVLRPSRRVPRETTGRYQGHRWPPGTYPPPGLSPAAAT